MHNTTVSDAMVEAAIDAWENVYEAELQLGSLAYTDNKEVAMRAAIDAALASSLAKSCGVKALEWTKAALDGKFGWLIVRYALTPFGRYYVEKFASANYRVSLNEQVLTSILPTSIDEGCSAAQADFERRILSTLSATRGCVCQDQHRRGHCTEPDCPYALSAGPSPVQGWREPKGWRAKFNLWFFRDLSDEQRLKLFSLHELPVDEIGKVHGFQQKALNHCLPASPKEG